MSALLAIANLQIVYDRSILAVKDVSLDVPEAAIVALLGSKRRRQVDCAQGDLGRGSPARGRREIVGGGGHYRRRECDQARRRRDRPPRRRPGSRGPRASSPS